MNFIRSISCTFLVLSFFSVAAQTPVQEGPANSEAEYQQQYQERIKKDKLNGVYIPKNLDDALLQLDKLTTPESREKFKAIPEDSVCAIMHYRLGQWIILNWGFYGGSRLSHYLKSAGITYPDDMADFIMLAYSRKLNGKTVNIKELATRFREKRKQEFEKSRKKGKVLKEEKRKKNR
ncbi:MAG: hypothetical protein LCH81_04340 [Bacteroidetes bacterium]|nr:hypothetical protein [Bacteroidota bacterium]